MGNYRFKLSDMIPNAWFYKLRDMGKGRKQSTTTTTTPTITTFSRKKKKQQPQIPATTITTTHSPKPKQNQQCTPRKSYYFTRELNQISNNKIHHTSPPPNNNTRISTITTTPETNNNYSPQEQPPRKSPSKQRARRVRRTTPQRISPPKLVTSSVSAGCSCRTTLDSVWTKSDSPNECFSSSSPFDSSGDSDFPEPEFRTDHVLLPNEPSSFDEMVSLATKTSTTTTTTTTTTNNNNNNNNNNNKDIVIDVDKNSLAREDDKLEGYHECDSFCELELPPIITKPSKTRTIRMVATTANEEEPNMKGSLKVKIVKELDTKASTKEQSHQQRNNIRGFSVSSPGVKLRINSPRLGHGGRKAQSHGRRSVSSSTAAASSGGGGSRRSLSGSFAVVKSSFNPQKDFRESMVEMIVENNIRASKDLEDLLACYLSLNSDEYHDLIIKVFKQIWFDLTETR